MSRRYRVSFISTRYCYYVVLCEFFWKIASIGRVAKMEKHNFEPSCAIRFSAKLGVNAIETFEKNETSLEILSKAHVFRWYREFSTDVKKLKKLTLIDLAHQQICRKRERNLDRRLTSRLISDKLKSNRFTVHHMYRDKRKTCFDTIPKTLTFD